jgi:hypothetical protein
VEFSDSAKLLRPMAPLSAQEKAQVNSQLSQIKSTGEYTDLLAPLKLGKEILDKSKREGVSQIIILFSDGKMEPPPKSGPAALLANELLNVLLPDLKAKDSKVYTLSFSDQADTSLLSQVAAGSNGAHWFTPTADKIHQSFAELFVVAKKPQMLPISSKGFRIDAEVQEATFYINHESDQEITLVKPSGAKVMSGASGEEVKWFKGRQFDVITIIAPEPGQWEIQGLPKNEGFATVLTSLKLTAVWPAAFNASVPTLLEARLFEAKKPVILPQMTGVVTYAFEITPTDRVSEPILREKLYDDGTHGDRIAGDGVFSSLVDIEAAGEYRQDAQAPEKLGGCEPHADIGAAPRSSLRQRGGLAGRGRG